MRAITKKGKELLFTSGCSNDWTNLTDEIIINLNNKWTYESFKFSKGNKLTIQTTEGMVVLVFSANLESITFEYHEKDQIGFKLKKKFI